MAPNVNVLCGVALQPAISEARSANILPMVNIYIVLIRYKSKIKAKVQLDLPDDVHFKVREQQLKIEKETKIIT